MHKQFADVDISVNTKYPVDTLKTWPEGRVHSWLIDVGFGKFAGSFLDNNIAGDVLFELKHEHLREMGIASVGERMKILTFLKVVKKRLSSQQEMDNTKLNPASAVKSGAYTGSIPRTTTKNSKKQVIPLDKANSLPFISKNGGESTAGPDTDMLKRKRLIRITPEDGQYRILDISGISTMTELFAKVLQKFSLQKYDPVTDAAKIQLEREKRALLYEEDGKPGRPVTEEDVKLLGVRKGDGDDGIPGFFLKRQRDIIPLATPQKPFAAKKYSKLADFFGLETDKTGKTADSAPKADEFFGNRPPSKLIMGNLTQFFPTMSSGGSSSEQQSTGKLTKLISTPIKAVSASQLDISSDTKEDTEGTENSSPPSAMKRPIKWAKGSLLGTGSFGNVFMGLNMQTGEIMAVKQVELPEENNDFSMPVNKSQNRRKQMVEALHREIDLLKDLRHPNIVQYMGSESTSRHLNIFLEYVPGGSIASALASYGVFEESLVRAYTKQILSGLHYLHERKIVHRDIKGANILIDNTGSVKITDFGISKKISDGKNNRGSVISLVATNPQNRTSSLQGSVFWMSPEVVKEHHYTKRSDIFSVGCVILEMLSGTHPWPDLSQMQAIYKIGSGETPQIPEKLGPHLADFLATCLKPNYKDRPTADILLTHEFIREQE